MKYLGILFFAMIFISTGVKADWITIDIDRMSALPTGNINFWSTEVTNGCGSQGEPYKLVDGAYSVNTNGVKAMTSVVLSAIASNKKLSVSVRDTLCRVDAITIQE